MGEPMTPWYVSLIFAWLPFMLLIGIAWYVGRAKESIVSFRSARLVP
jgi:hypothetical protein